MSEVRRYKHQWIEHGVDHHGRPIEIDMEADVVEAADHDRVVAEMQTTIDELTESWIKQNNELVDSNDTLRERIHNLETALQKVRSELYYLMDRHEMMVNDTMTDVCEALEDKKT